MLKLFLRTVPAALLITTVALTACGGQAPPPPVAATNTALPPAPTEPPTSPPPKPTDTPAPAVTNTPAPAPTDTPAPAPTDTPVPAPTEEAEQPSAELAQAANQIYTQKGCMACHGANHEGMVGPILVGLPAEHTRSEIRAGEPGAGMPAFGQNVISDEDLNTLVEFLSSLTLEDIGVELPPAVVGHLSQAWDALQAGNKEAVKTHLEEAQQAGGAAPPGVQATLKDVVEDLEEEDWAEDVGAHLRVLLGR